jgi:hypothetical protein
LAFGSELILSEGHNIAAVQYFMNVFACDVPFEPIVRAFLDRAVRRLRVSCAKLLIRKHGRLTLPTLNLRPDELLGCVVKRLLEARCSVGSETVRQFFAFVNRIVLSELNVQPLRQDKEATILQLSESRHRRFAGAPAPSFHRRMSDISLAKFLKRRVSLLEPITATGEKVGRSASDIDK